MIVGDREGISFHAYVVQTVASFCALYIQSVHTLQTTLMSLGFAPPCSKRSLRQN